MTSLSNIGRVHTRRLRDVYRSAGWPSQDAIEVDLLAAGLLERVDAPAAAPYLRLTATGLALLAQTQQSNRQALSVHAALVERVARLMQRDGRIVWTNLSLRARLPDADLAVDVASDADVDADLHRRAGGYASPTYSLSAIHRWQLIWSRWYTRSRSAGPTCWAI